MSLQRIQRIACLGLLAGVVLVTGCQKKTTVNRILVI